MRFFKDGPDIPDALIDARDLGEVVFFCGAGVSRPAGLPDFAGLADRLLDKLSALESRVARDDGESLDRVFTALVKEFGGAAVDYELSRALRAPRNANLSSHRAIINLSRGADGAAKIVTTNFDRLFERADPALRGYVPPTLPDLTQLQPIKGIVYLHGRLNFVEGARAGYVISSSDFGRAYLAEGWAARFVRDLSDRYTIVLLGYSADDPPMRYLLEGLSSREGERRPIYAFVAEGASASDESWRDKGVTTIAYAPRDTGHVGLWGSIFAWAKAARDSDDWRDRLISLGQSHPSSLQPFERGQVTYLVGTKAGATAFASAVPVPPAEWLCVFDANRRYAQPGKINWDDSEKVDPLEVFGLDSDPPRPTTKTEIAVAAIPGGDATRWRHTDGSAMDRVRLSGSHPEWSIALPARLLQLARWFGLVMDQPAAVWWASRSGPPNPGLLRAILHRLSRGDMPHDPARRFWWCYVEAEQARQRDVSGFRLYEVADRLKTDGWTNGVLRDLDLAAMPIFEIGPPMLASPVPPQGGWDVVSLRSIVEIKVTVATWPQDRLMPPENLLVLVIGVLRRSLVRLSEMLRESTVAYWRPPSLHPSGEHGESLNNGRKSTLFLKFRELFDKLVTLDPAAARKEVASWDSNDPTCFAGLFLYAATLPKLIDADEVAEKTLAMPNVVFWNSQLARDVLFAMRANWANFRSRTRRRVERRIVAGPPPYDGEKRREYAMRRQSKAASWLRWFQLNKRRLSRVAVSRLKLLKMADPRWTDDWARSAADSYGPRSGVVHRVTDSCGLKLAPLADLTTLAESLSTGDHQRLHSYRPFDGVVEAAPLRAVSALRLLARRHEWPEQYWRSLISNFPVSGRSRLTLLLAHTIAHLPENTFTALRHEIGDWARKFLGGLIKDERRTGLTAFDAITCRFQSAAPLALETSMGSITIGGVPQIESRYSVNKALNAPGGDLATVLIELIGKGRKGRKMPIYISTRIERLFDLPGDGGAHAASLVARQFAWLDYWFHEWAKGLLPLFDVEHPLAEATWHGFASDHHLLSDENGRRLKPVLLRLIANDAPWALDKEARKRLVEQMVHLTRFRAGKAVISFAEARRGLMAVSDEERSVAIMMLANSMHVDSNWSTFVKPFISRAWPRQLKIQSAPSSRAFALLIEQAGERFVEVVDLVLPFLRPVPHVETFIYGLMQLDKNGRGYSKRYPQELLTVLNAVVGHEPLTPAWNLGELLETIGSSMPALRQSETWRRLKAFGQ